jgi:hypothetical protein
MSKNLNPKLTSLDDLINQNYGEIGSSKRDEFEEGFEAFKIGVMMHELRKELGMTQEELALKCGTTKNYILCLSVTIPNEIEYTNPFFEIFLWSCFDFSIII